MIAWTLFYNPMPISTDSLLFLLLPLCVSVAIIYKTIRVRHVRALPKQIGLLILLIAAGLTALCVAIWAIQRFWP